MEKCYFMSRKIKIIEFNRCGYWYSAWLYRFHQGKSLIEIYASADYLFFLFLEPNQRWELNILKISYFDCDLFMVVPIVSAQSVKIYQLPMGRTPTPLRSFDMSLSPILSHHYWVAGIRDDAWKIDLTKKKIEKSEDINMTSIIEYQIDARSLRFMEWTMPCNIIWTILQE